MSTSEWIRYMTWGTSSTDYNYDNVLTFIDSKDHKGPIYIIKNRDDGFIKKKEFEV